MEPTDKHKIRLRTTIDNIHPLGNECWTEIEPIIYIKELDKNEYFSKEGQLPRELGVIDHGVLRIFYLNDKGEEWNKHFLQENDFVASGISPEKKSITNIQALSKVSILCIPYRELMKIATKYNQINTFIQKLTFEYLEQKQNREIRLLSEEAMNNYLMFKDTFPNLEDRIQHYHIASYLGITPTQLSRLRKKLERN
ncbi:cAMP-binding proteins - catabolite gene activator and regulatory subunit of cAMP-dependent protein kinases [hydrothermal vent metagenome]|uniref:cAMP-binding proteins - catabolite gene activator and regulatory subunit of cAMP-dependent protein kinases n=1 Tax=hydrothermal vent metagenome TaxID=652676 RepID=A0A3B0TG39_9ZZZZ